jgi:hypothetical protein
MAKDMAQYRGLIGVEHRPMSQAESEMLIRMTMAGQSETADWDGLHQDLIGKDGQPKSLAYAILFSRLEQVGMIDYISPELTIFISTLCDSPGTAVLWAYTLGCIVVDGEISKIGIKEWATYFPMGVPTDKGKETAWDGQKGGNIGMEIDNWLDNMENWPSI